MAFMRQLSFLQPFVFLFAAVAVTAVARLPKTRSMQRAAFVGGALAVLIVPAIESVRVFRAHAGLGRALSWIHENRRDSSILWLASGWAKDPVVRDLSELSYMAPQGAVVVGYWPTGVLYDRPSQRVALETTPSLFSAPSLWSTGALNAEGRGFGHNPFDGDPLLSTVQVWDAAALSATFTRGRVVRVTSVTADSEASPDDGPRAIFDHDRGGHHAWVSADTPGPHQLDVTFAEPIEVDRMMVVSIFGDLDNSNPSIERSNRIAEASVSLADESGAYREVWSGKDLQRDATLDARWPAQKASRVRITIRKQVLTTGPTKHVIVEEVAFPGYTMSL
jgi:hypothetical protein